MLYDVRRNAEAGFQKMQPSIDSLGLTPRQTDVLGLLLKGHPNKLIARELGLSVETIKDHVAAVLRVLNVSSRTQAVLAVSQMPQQQGAMNAWHRTR
jgi:DNA-binding NarL/FixJ family response regulator